MMFVNAFLSITRVDFSANKYITSSKFVDIWIYLYFVPYMSQSFGNAGLINAFIIHMHMHVFNECRMRTASDLPVKRFVRVGIVALGCSLSRGSWDPRESLAGFVFSRPPPRILLFPPPFPPSLFYTLLFLLVEFSSPPPLSLFPTFLGPNESRSSVPSTILVSSHSSAAVPRSTMTATTHLNFTRTAYH